MLAIKGIYFVLYLVAFYFMMRDLKRANSMRKVENMNIISYLFKDRSFINMLLGVVALALLSTIVLGLPSAFSTLTFSFVAYIVAIIFKTRFFKTKDKTLVE